MSKQKENQKLLDEVAQKIKKNLKCPLKDASTNLVFGKGNPTAQIFIIGEAPGEKEDLQGVPFVGRAGKNLDKLLNTIGLSIDDVYIANILKYRPPKNRDPTIEEIKNHTPYLVEQIKIIEPKVIATLGNYATKFILSEFNPDEMKKIEGIAELHGKPVELIIEGEKFVVVPIYHPAAMMYRPSLRESFEEDFRVMEKLIKGKNSKREKQKKLI